MTTSRWYYFAGKPTSERSILHLRAILLPPHPLDKPTRHATLLHLHPPTVVDIMTLHFGACVSLIVVDCCVPSPPFVITVKVVSIHPHCHCCHPGRQPLVIASPSSVPILSPMSAIGFIAKPNRVYCARPATTSSTL